MEKITLKNKPVILKNTDFQTIIIQVMFPYKKDKKKTPLPLPIILDSHIDEETLKILNKDKKWILNILRSRKLKLEDIFYAFYKDDNVFIIKHSDLL